MLLKKVNKINPPPPLLRTKVKARNGMEKVVVNIMINKSYNITTRITAKRR